MAQHCYKCGHELEYGPKGPYCMKCREYAPVVVVPVNPPDVKTCPTCSRREDYESMEFLENASRCPTCKKK